MNYIWETVLAAKRDGIEETDLYFKAAKIASPYIEVSFCDLNTSCIEEKNIEVNPIYRFADVFAGIIDKNVRDFSKTREVLFDVAFHYLAHTDLRMGLHKQEYYSRFILEELEKGIFGSRGKSGIYLFDTWEKKHMIASLMDVYCSGNYIRIFTKLMKILYEYSIVYVSQDQANEVLIYVGEKETEQEIERMRFLTETFFPVGEKVEIFYLNHFGILDVEETMDLDRILLI